MRRVLLTGAAGFIGSHCIRPLTDRGYEVHAVSRSPRAADGGETTWYQADLLRPGAARTLVDRVKPTHLLHLAWFVVPGKLITAPENFDWVSASLELVRRFAEAGGTRLSVCGSGYEYDWAHGYCTEEITPCVPDTVYGACKHALHEMVRTFAAGRGLSAAWPRVFFLYGPKEHPERLVSSVIRSLLRKEPARCSHGKQIRDYLHVQDVADGLVAVLDSEIQGAVNVSSGQATTLREIASTIGRLTGQPELVQLGAIPARANDAPLVVGSNARAAALGWQPRFDLESGLLQTIEWWRGQDGNGGQP
ncbi:MAG: NAD-dependent epimerase/dehydratase family protein [Gemmatimonadales bacterium]